MRAFQTRGEVTLPIDVRTTADEMHAALVSDLGGAQNLTALKRELAAQGRTCRIILDLITRHLVETGVTTKRKLPRQADSSQGD